MARSKARKRRSSIFPSFKNEKNEKENTENKKEEKELPKQNDIDNDAKKLQDDSSNSMVLSQEQYDAIFCDDDNCKKDKDSKISDDQPVRLSLINLYLFSIISVVPDNSAFLQDKTCRRPANFV